MALSKELIVTNMINNEIDVDTEMAVGGSTAFVSKSASISDKMSDDTVANSLVKVKLDADRESTYNTYFFPKIAGNKKAKVNVKHYADVITTLADFSSGFEQMFAGFRAILQYGRTLDTVSQDERNNWVAQRFTALATADRSSQNMLAVKSFYDMIVTGKSFVIKPSTRFPGGFDLVYSGIPITGASTKTSLQVPNNDYGNLLIGVNANDEYSYNNYLKEKREAYSTSFSLKAQEAAKAILKSVFQDGAAADIGSAHKRLVVTLPLTFDFKSLNQLCTEYMGLTQNFEFFKSNISSDTINTGLQDYISLLVMRNPLKEIVSVHERQLKAKSDQPLPPIDNKQYLSDESILMHPELSFSIVAHIPKDIAHFITQCPEDKPVAVATLYNWAKMWTAAVLKRSGAKASANATFGGVRIGMRKLPRYILPASAMSEIVDTRKKNNYYVEPGRCNEDSLYVSANGTLNYCPNSEATLANNASEYEKDMEGLLQAHYDNDIPVDLDRVNPVSSVLFNIQAGRDLADEIKAKRKALDKHAGKLLNYTWDYDTIISVSSGDPSAMATSSLSGAVKPSVTAIADYLGFANDEEAPKTFAQSMKDLLASCVNEKGEKYKEDDFFSSGSEALLNTPAMEKVFNLYTYFAVRKQVPGFNDLLETAKKDLNLTTLKDTLEEGLYYQVMTDTFTVRDALANRNIAEDNAGFLVRMMMQAAMHEAAGGRGSSLRKKLSEDYTNYTELENALQEHERFFNARTSKMSDFGNLYNYVGGRVFQLAMNAILAIPQSVLLSSGVSELDGKELTPENSGKQPSFANLSREVMPIVTMFSKYVPKHKEIFEQAAIETTTFKPDSKIGIDEIHIPGVIKGAQLFPHQTASHAVLRQRPKAAFLDIDPGGGKTSLGITDACACVKEMQELGVKIKPLMIAPDGLVKNWCDDLVKFTNGSWNVIPLTSKVYNRWGQDRLEELLASAPPNTLVVAGINFLKSKVFPIVLGANSVMVSGTLEFIKRFNFNYILLDESHKAKNPRSLVHQTIKQLTTASSVRYIRLATGTLISNKLTDVVGQTALISSHIFRTPEEYEEEYSYSEGNSSPMWYKDTPKRARLKLARHAAVITKKRKEWAFMLPNPIESFIPVSLVDESVKYSELHMEVYNAVLQETLDVLQQNFKSLTKKDEDEEDDSDDEDNGKVRKAVSSEDEEDSNEEDMDLDEKEDPLSGLEGLLRPYLQRLERILTDPLGDPLGHEIFKKAGIDNFVSRKVLKIIEIVKEHFNVPEWSKSAEYRELDLVSYNGKLYMLRKVNHASLKRETVPNNQRPPNSDTETWKEEPKGKVLIFCRYSRSVNAIYNALPPELQKRARKFSGEEGGNKWANLDDFKKDPSVEILVANEQAMTEGHNLQGASRLIRVEQPWAPGDLDQASARIFRPDPTAAKNMAQNGKPGELYRELIYLDWVIANGTMEVAKLGRLIQKIVNKTKFDETGNSRYAILDDVELEPISMSLDTISSRHRLSDMVDYTDEYSTIKAVQREEFSEMRRSQAVRMDQLTESPNVEGAARLDFVPLLPDQSIPDPDGFGLVSGREFIHSEDNSEFRNDPKTLIGLPIKVEFGTGQIVNVRIRFTKNEFGEKIVDVDNPVSSITVRLGNSDDLLTYNLKEVYFATKLTDKNRSLFTTTKPWATETQRKRITQELQTEEQDQEELEAEQAARERKEKIKALRQSERQEAARERGNKRKQNVEQGKQPNDGIAEVKGLRVPKLGSKEKPKAVVDASDTEENMVIDIVPSVYNGFLTVSIDGVDPDAKDLQKLGFRYTGPYAYVSVINGKQFNAFLDYVESKFVLSRATEKRLEDIQAFFDESAGYRFKADLASTSELANFFRTSHRVVTDKKEIKVYPLVLEDKMVFAVDIETNPRIRSHLGKKIDGIPGSAGKWQESPGAAMYFAKNKIAAKDAIRTLKQAGYTVQNEKDFLAQLAELQFRKKRGE